MTWADLSDDELLSRLQRRVTSTENAENLPGVLVRLRDDPTIAEAIDAILDRPGR